MLADASFRIQNEPSHAARNSTCWPGTIGQSTGPGWPDWMSDCGTPRKTTACAQPAVGEAG